MPLTLGADPEFFLKGPGENSVSAYGIIPGTKYAPHKVPAGAVQVDGMALEFNIDPASTIVEFRKNIQEVLIHLRKMVPEQYNFSFSPVGYFSTEEIKKQPPEALMLGCDPDFDAYAEQVNPPPKPHPTMRTAAGHVHFGWDEGIDPHNFNHFIFCCNLVKHLDYYLGLPSLLLDPCFERRKMYGKAGAFRPKPYGVEYRVLSNFWLQSDELIDFVYKNATIGFETFVTGHSLPKKYGNLPRKIINSNNVKAASILCKKLGIEVEP